MTIDTGSGGMLPVRAKVVFEWSMVACFQSSVMALSAVCPANVVLVVLLVTGAQVVGVL